MDSAWVTHTLQLSCFSKGTLPLIFGSKFTAVNSAFVLFFFFTKFYALICLLTCFVPLLV